MRPSLAGRRSHGAAAVRMQPTLKTPALLLFLALPLAAQAPDHEALALPAAAAQAMAGIEPAPLLAHARYLASDELAGRLTGTKEQRLAAEYIQRHFEQLGLEPLGDEIPGGRSWFQTYGIDRTAIDGERTRLQFGSVEAKDGFAVVAAQPLSLDLTGKLRFCGFGRTRGTEAEIGTDETLAESVPIVLLRGPRGRVDRPLGIEQKFGMAFQSLGVLGSTAKNLGRKGAKVVVFAMLEDPTGICDVLNYLAVSPGKDLSKATFPGAMPGMASMAAMLGGGDTAVIVLAPPLSAKVFAELGVDRDAAAKFAASRAREELPAAKADVAGHVALEVVNEPTAEAWNVCAVLRGSDPELAAEAVVYSAHMDHIGRRMDGAIFHGADDNASGSAGLLELAAAFARCKQKPRRSIVFLSVSGEELGLWGSKFYAEHPTWPLEQIAADINTDMIGRFGPECGETEVMVTPSHEHRMFSTLVQQSARIAEQLGLQVVGGDKYYERSDHYNFADKGVPVVFFCNGEHADYHQVTDTVDKLDGKRMQLLTRLAFWTGWLTADADERPRTLGRRPDWK